MRGAVGESISQSPINEPAHENFLLFVVLVLDDEGAHVGCQSGLRPRDTPLRHTQVYHPLGRFNTPLRHTQVYHPPCLTIPVNLPEIFFACRVI